MQIKIPEFSLVVLIGSTGSGKSSFARKFFKPTEIVSSDTCRGIVSDDENNQAATKDAFELVHYIIRKRLKNGLLTVVDATNVQPESRKALMQIAREYHALVVAIVFNLPDSVCLARNNQRPDRQFGSHVVRQHNQNLKKSLKTLKSEGFRQQYILDSEAEVNAVQSIVRQPLYNNRKYETGPFDIIGDVHGCFDELKELLEKLGYQFDTTNTFSVTPPAGRKAFFVGDLVDRGPNSPDVLRLVMQMVKEDKALCVPGNHDVKLLKYLNGRNVQLKHGLDRTVEQLASVSQEFLEEVKVFLDGLISHFVVDDGRLVVAHAGLKEEMQGRGSGAVREFCLYGETTGEIDEFGLPVRINWAAEYRGKTMVVYGHTPVVEAQWQNNTIDIDTGCVFGGKLTALRYPEKELVSVKAKEVYAQSTRPLDFEGKGSADNHNPADAAFDIDDVIGKQIIHTRLHHSVTIREQNAMAALEVMSRFAINPKWLIYLPPTMSPTETSKLPDLLEYPSEAFKYYSDQGVTTVVCEEKHMGSRAIVVLCRDEETALKRFGVSGEGIGVCYTRTGRSFFTDNALEQAFLERIKVACDKTGFWDKFETDWVLLDCELMPWSAKAQALLQNQYAAVGAAATHALPMVNTVLAQAKGRGLEVEHLLKSYTERQKMAEKFVTAYRHYCWPVASLDDYKLAPFHLLATEGKVHTDKTHRWHMDTLAELCDGDSQLLFKTPYKVVDLQNEAEIQQAIVWWEQLTYAGGEGFVVKPMEFIVTNEKGLVQPAIKCRGSEYLRIIYGPEYSSFTNITRLKSRSLGGKRSLALREFALGMEALEKFVERQSLRTVHQCVFGVLALESEPIDPRL
ncbi:polynucleotide kinase-phosphatase [Xanthocytophaga flava]|uniref:polynucleotide kinase-phosphatase n=1 Tax=Xanthocytophaga flava TaxID=3048013 RepID=UPI0028D19857|nr:polynucleotide kinase-phosphatase [Xanthocytophaga flavus]MDJ1467208.1 polynucleotide kinase-phosphatase [Xanthocytophaga flavus]